jgi:hypothetical protein
MTASTAGFVIAIAWVFFALGPQLALCLYLGYRAAVRSAGDTLNWLLAAFLVSLIPIAGVVVMIVLWQRAGTRPPAKERVADGERDGAELPHD